MLRRHAISDEQWGRIQHLLPGRAGTPGRPAQDNRLFVDAVLWIGKTGAPWRGCIRRSTVWRSASSAPRERRGEPTTRSGAGRAGTTIRPSASSRPGS